MKPSKDEYVDRNIERAQLVNTSLRMQELPGEALVNEEVAREIAGELCGQIDSDLIRAIASGNGNQALALLQVAYTKSLKNIAEYWAIKNTEETLRMEFEEITHWMPFPPPPEKSA